METLRSFAVFIIELDLYIKLPLIAVLSYLLGSINTSIIVSKVSLHKDIRNYGSGNAGLTNAIRSMGWKRGLIVLVGDVSKCALAIIAGQLIFSGNMSFDQGAGGRLIAGTFVFLGHVYPLYFGFRGGKGVLTFGTTMAMFDWRIFLIAFSIFLLISLITRYVSLGSIIGASTVPLLVMLFSKTSIASVEMSWGYTGVAAFLAALVVFKHRKNIVRLVRGTESKFSLKGKALMEEDV